LPLLVRLAVEDRVTKSKTMLANLESDIKSCRLTLDQMRNNKKNMEKEITEKLIESQRDLDRIVEEEARARDRARDFSMVEQEKFLAVEREEDKLKGLQRQVQVKVMILIKYDCRQPLPSVGDPLMSLGGDAEAP